MKRLGRKAFEDMVMKKYSSMSREAALKKVCQAEWLMRGVSSALDLLRPFTNLLLGHSKLSQAFNLLSDAVREWKERKEQTGTQMW